MMNLLPPNSTNFEKKIVETTSKLTNLNADLSSLIRVDDAPSDFLSILAWQFSVDRWQDDWSDDVKRAQIKNSIKVHTYKGTNFALRSIVESFGYSITIYEWWQEVPMNEPGTFQISIDTNNQELTEQGLKTLIQLLDDARPLTRHCKNIQINVTPSYAQIHALAGSYSGEDTTIFPEVPDILMITSQRWAFYEQHEIEIYPFGAYA